MTYLPSGWVLAKLGDIADWSSGGTPKSGTPEYYGGEIPWVVTGDLTDGPVRASAQTITQLGLAKSSAKLVPPGTVLVAMYGASIGRVGIAGMHLTTNQAIANAQVHSQVALPEYILYYLLSQRRSLAAAGKGAAQPNIGQGVLKEWPIPVAPLPEQQRIVAAIEEQFSRLDAGVDALQSSWTKLRLMRRALLHSAITGKLIGTTTDGWRNATLGEVVTDIHAGKSFKCEERPAQPDEWGVIKVSAMTWGEFLEQENKTVLPGREIDMRMEIREGDLLVSRANTVDYVGAVVLVRKSRPRLLLSDKSLRLLPSSVVLPEWLVITLRSPEARRYIEGVATGTSDSMRNISQPKLRALRVPLPPIDVQRELIAEVARYSAVIAELDSALKRQLTRADRLRSSILADAYAGRLAILDPSDRSPAHLHPVMPNLAGPDGQRVAANHLVETGVVA